MSSNACPECGKKLGLDEINLAEGVALCAGCGELSRLSEVTEGNRSTNQVLDNVPAGCDLTIHDKDIVIKASLRSMPGFLGTLAVTLFWNGIVSVFVLTAAAGLYINLVGPLPDWFPAPEIEKSMTLGMSLFLCVFLIPFVTFGAFIFGAMLLNMAGRIELVIGPDNAFVRTGIGFLSWRRRFDPSLVRHVREAATRWHSEGKPNRLIEVEWARMTRFGTLLTDERREWLHAVLRVLLTDAKPHKRAKLLANAKRTI